MTYRFSGIIGFTEEMNFEELGGVALLIDSPFRGKVHAFAADYSSHELNDWELNAIQAWSADNPDQWLIYLAVECFGGRCDESGFVLKAGAVRAEFDWAEDTLVKLFAAAQHPIKDTSISFLERGAFSFDDDAHMRRALAMARTNHGKTGKNPSVGCVVVNQRGIVLGESVTGLGGDPHAEEAILIELGKAAKGATAYVTLEPCRQRSTSKPSCSDHLAKAGIGRVVYAVGDRHRNGAGGADFLNAKGIQVESGLRESEALALYQPFFDSL